jgi:hypothetical protein
MLLDAIKGGVTLKKSDASEASASPRSNTNLSRTTSGGAVDMNALLSAIKNPQLKRVDSGGADRKSIFQELNKSGDDSASSTTTQSSSSIDADPILARRMRDKKEETTAAADDNVAAILAFAIMARRDNLTKGLDENDLHQSDDEDNDDNDDEWND